MFFSLFLKECKQVLKSMVYYLYLILFLLFMTSQMSETDFSSQIKEPKPGQEDYGMKISHQESDIMEKALISLVRETTYNSYATYPFGFYKGVTLNEEEREEVIGMVEDLAGKEWEELLDEREEYYSDFYSDFDQMDFEKEIRAMEMESMELRAGLTYQEFQENMERVCRILGRGSSYEKSRYDNSAMVPKTYEDACLEYQDLCSEDRVTGALMRLFCDYAGIMLALLPIFLGVSRCLRDKRAKAKEVVFAKEASSAQVVFSRYLANVILSFLPVVLTAWMMQKPYGFAAKEMGIAVDGLAFLKYCVVWLLPEIMAVLAVSFVITEATETVLAILFQGFWAFSGMLAVNSLVGDFGLHLVARWNEFGETARFLEQKQQLYVNRGFYLALAVCCMAASVWFYGRKRRGGMPCGKVFKARA